MSQKASIGFIGAGNMGSAMIRGILKSGVIQPDQLHVYDSFPDKSRHLEKELGITVNSSEEEVAKFCNILIPAVKPAYMDEVLSKIAHALTPEHLVISIAAGISIQQLKNMVQDKCHVIRTMPNTPALVGEGMTAICADNSIPESCFDITRKILCSFGKTAMVTEDQIHAVTGISGSSPAYAFLFMEALADGGVAMGLPREQSYQMAAQALLGAAKMVLETGQHPGELKDMVCSPAGTTIEAVASLEKDGFRGIITEAVRICAEKSKSMGRKQS